MKRCIVGRCAVVVAAWMLMSVAHAQAKLWWESPEVRATVDTGVNNGGPHYMNKDESDQFLFIHLHSSSDSYPAHLYSIPRLIALYGTTGGVALASAKAPELFGSGTTATTNGWKGGAVSDDAPTGGSGRSVVLS